jgi:Zn-dependent M28 family amino/carboxypeptidase
MDDATVGRLWRDPEPWRLLTDLAATPRFGGHPGEARAAARVADAFRAAGLSGVRTESFELTRWHRGETTLTVAVDGRERRFDAIALPYSPAGEVTAPLVDAGSGTPSASADAGGGVAVVSTAAPEGADRHVHRMEKLGHAVDAGARAFVLAGHRPGGLPTTGALRFGREAAVPGVAVSKETGAWLREYAGREATLAVDARTESAESQNVRAAFGPDTAEAVLLTAHYDAHDVGEGALDNGCGVATLLGAVRGLAGADAEPGCRVEVAATGSEELGLLGAEALADRLDTDRLRAVVNFDGVGRFRDLRAGVHASDALGTVARAVATETDHPVAVDADPHPWSDHWPFLRAGVPSLQLHSARPGSEGPWERGYTHTRADTRDKADPRTLRTHAVLAAVLVEHLSETALDGIDPVRVRERLRETGSEPGMRAAGVWPAGWS